MKPGTVSIVNGVVETFTDLTLNGKLTGSAGGTGSINYVTGAYSVTFTAAPLALVDFVGGYSYYTLVAPITSLDHVSTNSVGSVQVTETIPALAVSGFIEAFDAKGVFLAKGFTVGPTIQLSPTSATSGSVVHILGYGFTSGDTFALATAITLTEPGMLPQNCKLYNPSTVTADPSGRFSMDVIIPSGKNVKDDYTLTVTADLTTRSAAADFEVTGTPSTSVSPSFNVQGGTITVSGKNYEKVSGVTVTVDLELGGVLVANIGTTTTKSDGTFSSTFTVPLQASNSYKIRSYITAASLTAKTSFTIGNLQIALSKTSGPVGLQTTLTGSGFTITGNFNVTIGSKTLLSSTAVGTGGALTPSLLRIPTLAPGTYTVTVFDIASGISVTTPFTVTAGTALATSSTTFPTGFNVTITGSGFAYPGGGVNFILYNKTSAGLTGSWWTITVYNNTGITTLLGVWTPPAAVVNWHGQIGAWWISKPGGTKLSAGTYYVNATDSLGYKATTSFTIGGKHIVATSRKTSYAIGETISFTLEHSFGNVAPVSGSKIKVYDPSGTIVYAGDALTTWVRTGDWYTVPYSAQTAGLSPMTLRDDAAIGTWTWKWVDTNGDTISSGTFAVTASPTSQTSTQMTDLSKQITDLKTQISGVTTAVQGIQSASSGAQTTASAALTAATAASTAATAAATAAQAALVAATAAGTKADAATAAANNAAAAANGLTTLVYAAIGASLVAALAAIVALMQISRKIA